MIERKYQACVIERKKPNICISYDEEERKEGIFEQ